MHLNRLLITILIIVACLNLTAQTVSSIGSDKNIDIANWNVNWLGKTESGYGPANDTLQQSLVLDVLQKAEIDIWILSEVSDTNVFKSMMTKLGRYRYVISSHNQIQKNAVIYDSSLFRAGPTYLLAENNFNSFSTGRFPLMVTLIPKKADVGDTLFIIALHLKANTGNDSMKLQAYESRRKSCEWLANFLKTKSNSKRILIAGDWNDDLDVSIYNQLPSSLIECKKLNPDFTFLTQILTDNNISTTLGFDNPIDHQLASNALLHYYISDSTFVWHIENSIADFSKNCSDHLPVISRFSIHLNPVNSVPETTFHIYPNPASSQVYLQYNLPCKIQLIDMKGNVINIKWIEANKMIDLSELTDGIYTLLINFENGYAVRSIVVQHE